MKRQVTKNGVVVTKDRQGFAYKIPGMLPTGRGHPIFAIELLIRINPKIGCAPKRSAIPSGAELLGAMTSLGPSRESYKPS
jgi:hypothetical protein